MSRSEAVGRAHDPAAGSAAFAAAGADRRTLLLLSLVSGLGGVVYEVLYMRHLTSVLGDMFYVHAGLLCMFLLGNGIGAWLAHRFVPYLFAFELAIGGYALALPGIVEVYEASLLARLFPSPVVQSLFASGLLLAVPSVCIGFSIPLFSAYIRRQGATRDAFKLAYLLYNLGAAISVVLVEFYLIRWVGFTVSLYCVAAANLTCGVVLLGRRKRWTPGPLESSGAGEPVPWRSSVALLLASIAAAVFLGLFIKVCYHLFLPHRQNFAICTAISLVSIAVGTWLAKRTRAGLDTFLVLSLASVAVVYVVFEPAVALFELAEETLPAWTTVGRDFVFGFFLSIPYVFLGATIPALLQRETQVARRSGWLLLVSGVGNVVGMLIFMFVLHPNVKVFTIPLAIWALLIVSLVVHAGPRVGRWRLAVVVASALLLPVVYTRAERQIYLVHETVSGAAAITHYKATSDNVSLVEGPNGTYISYNGHPSIYVRGRNGRVNNAEIVSGIIPALVAPRLDDALVLGLGSGITAGSAATLFEHTDVVEINSAFFPLLDRIADANFSITRNPRANIIHDDARSFLASTSRRYDVIVNSIPSPTYFAAGKIYTAEFFDMVERALVPGGVYCSWLAPVDMSRDGLETFLATLSSRFRFCNLAVLRNGYYYASCSDEPLSVRDPRSLDFPPTMRGHLSSIRGVGLEEYLESLWISDDLLSGLDLSGVPLNTDAFPVMEFQIMRQDLLLKDPVRMKDPLVTRPARFNLAPRDPAEAEAFVRQAVVLRQVHGPLYVALCVPRLVENPSLGDAFERRWAEISH